MKDKFLQELKKELAALYYSDIDDTIAYFDEMIEDKLDEGYTIEEVIAGLGDVKSIAKTLSLEEDKNEKKEVLPEPEEVEISEDDKDMVFKTIALEEATKISIDSINTNFEIILSDDDHLKLSYEKCEEAELVIGRKGNKIKIEYKEDYVASLFNRRFNKKSSAIKNARLAIPARFQGYLKFEGVNAGLKVDGLSLAVLKLESVNGTIDLGDISANELKAGVVNGDLVIHRVRACKTDLETVNGRIEIDQIKTDELKLNSVSGNIVAKKIEADFINVDTVNGKIDLEIIGREDEYAIRKEGLFNDERQNWELHKEKALKITTVSGKIKYCFTA